jgi:hypothetical protein
LYGGCQETWIKSANSTGSLQLSFMRLRSPSSPGPKVTHHHQQTWAKGAVPYSGISLGGFQLRYALMHKERVVTSGFLDIAYRAGRWLFKCSMTRPSRRGAFLPKYHEPACMRLRQQLHIRVWCSVCRGNCARHDAARLSIAKDDRFG